MSADRWRTGPQVSLTQWRDCSSHLTLVAVILSSVSQALITLSHLVWISLSVCTLFYWDDSLAPQDPYEVGGFR